ncbi:MAG: hypothetical protein IJV85_05930, partial [Clostridia bacterium]|nr:hypothetical protein [Clostridia bacterium]
VDPNAKVTFNLYWEDLMGVDQITVNKEVSYHRDNLKDTTANVWQKFEVSLSVLLTNWDKQGVGGDGNGASAALVGFSSSTATVTGNYVIYMADLTLETTASEEETLDPEESSKVVSSPAESSEEESSEEESSEETPPSIYKCENAWFNSYTPSAISEGKVYYVCNGVKSTSKGKIVYLDEFEGETGVYQVKTLSDYDQINGIVIEAIYDKSYYEEIVAVFPQATVNVDVWWDSDELDGATILQTNDKYDHGFSDYEGNEWVTLKISLATLIDNWDNMGNVSSTKGSFVSIGLNATDNYSFYVTNVRIEALTWNSFDYQKTSAPMAYGAVAYSATSSGIGDETSGATLEYLSDFSGREGVIKVKTNGTNLDGYNGLYITPKYDVSVYEQVLQKYPNATVNIDIGALSDEMKISTMLRYSLGLYDIGSSYSGYMDTFVTSHSDEVNWFTVSMDLADLVDHMNLGLPYSRGFYFLVIDQEDNEEELRDYCYYLSNIRINRGADYELPAYHEIDEDMVRNIQTFGSTEEGIAEVEYVTEYADVSNVLKISNTSNFTGSSGAYICPGLSLAEMATFYNQGVTVKMDVYLESMSGAITINDEAFIAIPGQWYTFEMSAYDIYKDYEENGRKRSGFIINVEHPEGEGSYCLYVGNIRWVVNGVEIVSNT